MIIDCTNCNKKFEVDPVLIPEKGRSIQCGSCDYKWFYKKESQETTSEINDVTTGDEIKQEIQITEHLADEKKIIEEIVEDKIEIKQNNEKKPLKKSNILNKIISYLIVVIISLISDVASCASFL